VDGTDRKAAVARRNALRYRAAAFVLIAGAALLCYSLWPGAQTDLVALRKRLDAGEVSAVVAQLAKLPRRDDEQARLYAEALLLAGRMEDARAELYALISRPQPDLAQLTDYGELLLHAPARPEDAEGVARRALELSDGFARARFLLGSALAAQERFEEARTELETAIVQAPLRAEWRAAAELEYLAVTRKLSERTAGD